MLFYLKKNKTKQTNTLLLLLLQHNKVPFVERLNFKSNVLISTEISLK